ncbi:MAG TPA: ferredoxin [Desulfotomaculum sp.]|nr:MAG: Uncharacterized protein XD84_1514 [Desulfotomaculum sp. 46_80]HAG10661.1 ferredoxin [Desulfotomaculum sp.]HBY03786.1 ferredoxin [Desulfotomaculum sp.]
MKRKIIKIDDDRCNGCGLCIDACHEGALQLVEGKARLVSDIYCDGLGACLPACPTGAIIFEDREAEAFDEEAVKKHLETRVNSIQEKLACGCAGIEARTIERKDEAITVPARDTVLSGSQLRQWPCQIKLVPVNAPYFDNAHLLVAADCTAYAYHNIHNHFMSGKITIIGCPKLDNENYAKKMTEIFKAHEIRSVIVLRMEVPCCSGIANMVKQALADSGKIIPLSVVIITIDGCILGDSQK